MGYENNSITPGNSPSYCAKKGSNGFYRGKKTVLCLLNKVVFEPFILVNRSQNNSLAEL